MKSGDDSKFANDLSLVIERLGGGSSFHRFRATAVLTWSEPWVTTAVLLHREDTSDDGWDDGTAMPEVEVKGEGALAMKTYRLEFDSTGSGPFRFRASSRLTRMDLLEAIIEIAADGAKK